MPSASTSEMAVGLGRASPSVQRGRPGARHCASEVHYWRGIQSYVQSHAARGSFATRRSPGVADFPDLRRTVRSHGGVPFRDGSSILHYLCGGQ